MNKSNFTLKAILVAIVYWLADATVHCFIYNEKEFVIIPVDLNELWMRLVIIGLIIMFGVYADRRTREILEKEREKQRIFAATVRSTQHILNNLLNQMQYFRMIAEEAKAFDQETIELYESTIEQGKDLVEKLSAVEELSVENINNAVFSEMQNKS